MGKALDFSPNLIRDAPGDIDRAFKIVEERLADGRRFLSGDKPGILDIVFSDKNERFVRNVYNSSRFASPSKNSIVLNQFAS